MKKFVCLLACILTGTLGFAAATDTTLLKAPFHISLVPPLNPYGLQASKYKFNFSLNAIGGRTGGLDGFEAGGLWNSERSTVNGFQVAGLLNAVGGDLYGIQISGLMNRSRSVSGAQIGGLVNYSKYDLEGIQIGGLYNHAKRTREPQQLKFSTQISGLVNTAKDVDLYVQISGMVNTGRDIKGTQITGIYNRARQLNGTQISGIVNRAKGSMSGIQVGGILNYAEDAKGIQIGLINYSDSLDGYAIGLINIAKKNGVYRWEVMASDALFTGLRFSSGVGNVYSTFTLGAKYTRDVYWAYGIGFGVHFKEKPKYRQFAELHWYHVTEKELWNKNYFNHLFSFQRGIEWKTSQGQSLLVAPSLNMYFSHRRDNHFRVIEETRFPPYALITAKGVTQRFDAWLGLQLTYRWTKQRKAL